MTAAVGEVAESAGWFTIAVSDELRAHMARKRLSGRELARRLHVSHTWMSQRTKGSIALSTDEIERICDVLGITPQQLLAGAFQPRPGLQPPIGTEVNTSRYFTPSVPERAPLWLVPPLDSQYQDGSDRYGSCPSTSGYAGDRSTLEWAGTVNHADSA